MAISQRIIQLTQLALSDKVLTYVERQTIVDAATSEGIAAQEINEYLDAMLTEKLSQYDKTSLKKCPHCGAQIPLVSDTCLFCGGLLETGDASKPTTPPIFVTGAEAEIIRGENLRTAQQSHDIRNCPDCGAPFPLISNICTSCGHILHEQTDSDLNIRNLISNINQSIKTLKEAPVPTLGEVLWFRFALVNFAVAAVTLVLAINLSEHPTAMGIFEFISVIALFNAFKALKDDTSEELAQSPVRLADECYYNAVHDMEMYTRKIETLYGDNREAKDLLNEYAAIINAQKAQRAKSSRKLAIILAILVVLLFVIPFCIPSQTI